MALKICLKDSLSSPTRTFIKENLSVLEEILSEELLELHRELSDITGAQSKLLLRAFLKSRFGWEKFFWARLAQYWLKTGLALEDSIRLTDEDLLAYSSMIKEPTVPTEVVEIFTTEDTTDVTLI